MLTTETSVTKSQAECLNCGDKIVEPQKYNILHTKTFGDIWQCDICLTLLVKMKGEASLILG